MNLADMQALVAVVDTGSLAHAAVKLNLTQPAVTRRIQRLEKSLGAKLLDRDVKPARPTAEGEAAYAECVRVLAAADGLKTAFGRAPGEALPLCIGVSLGAADLVLPALLPAPAAAAPLTIETARSASLESAVMEGRFAAVLVFRHAGREPGAGEKVAHLPVQVVAPRALKLPDRLALRDLRGKRWVLCPDGCGYRRALEHGLYGASQPLDIAAAIWGFEQQARLVAAGAGLGLLPERILRESPTANALQPIEVKDFSAALDLWLVRAPGAGKAAARLDAVVAALQAELGEARSSDRAAGVRGDRRSIV
jgi:DNA-binding transcriptional LysR family regulator